MTSNEILFLFGAAVFAVTGVLTAIGGGTVRDLILGLRPFWLQDPAYLYVTSGAAVATFFFERRFRAGYNVLLYLDALATAVFTIIAAERTLQLGFEPGIAVLMGVITGIGGGVVRDLLTGQPTILMRRELYMTPIIIGGALYVVVRHNFALAPLHASLLGIAAIAFVRLGAIRWSWAFPDWLTYRPAK
jgi:uncharacterized membrane protein YeiH